MTERDSMTVRQQIIHNVGGKIALAKGEKYRKTGDSSVDVDRIIMDAFENIEAVIAGADEYLDKAESSRIAWQRLKNAINKRANEVFDYIKHNADREQATETTEQATPDETATETALVADEQAIETTEAETATETAEQAVETLETAVETPEQATDIIEAEIIDETAIQTSQTSQSLVTLYLATITNENSKRAAMNAFYRIARLAYDEQFLQTHSRDYVLSTLNLEQLTASIFKQIKSRLETEYSAGTVNQTLSVIRQAMKFAWQASRISHEQYMKTVSIADVKYTQPTSGRDVDSSELAKLYAIVNELPQGRKERDKAMLVILQHGLRVSELCSLELTDFDNEQLTVRNSKNNTTRHVKLSAKAASIIQDWIAVRGQAPGSLITRSDRWNNLHSSAGLGTQSARDWLKRLTETAGLKPMTPHDFRRTFVGDLLDSGVDISTIAKIAGHKQVNTTQRYDRRDERAQSAAVEKIVIPV